MRLCEERGRREQSHQQHTSEQLRRATVVHQEPVRRLQ
jgi:hypothetical protein